MTGLERKWGEEEGRGVEGREEGNTREEEETSYDMKSDIKQWYFS